ncbi:hypothetical protein [Deinococcus humi]|uniref:Uncharacterized protein n=1 Tax=Deinococcus humi TaxID=662880 RepID=A0A7W8JRY2_9DEIO|nr:hypothetical protein [Deinococcus humi]MBB5362105.1 hypothetical protein [Deinococcus humi]GGO22051.1 hypothetical protein GCM10008949_08920 [Deinococcus humi]
MTAPVPLSDQQWAAFLDAAGASLTRWGFRVRPVGIPIPTTPEAAALVADGRGCLVVYRAGHVEYMADWPTRLCDCTNGRRNQPLINCPHCRGEGTVTT